MTTKDTPKQVEHMVNQALRDSGSWLRSNETFMMSLFTLKPSPSFVRVCIPFQGSKLYDNSPLASLHIEVTSRKDPEEVNAPKREKNKKTMEERERVINLELDIVFPILKKIAVSQKCKIVRQKDSITIAK